MKRAPGPSIELTFTVKGRKAKVVFEPSRKKIGRVPGCDLVIDDSLMSREHAFLICEQERWLIQDNKSANGTWVNGERVRLQALDDGDMLKFGSVELKCRMKGGAKGGAPIDPMDVELEGLMTQSIAVDDFDELVRSVLEPVAVQEQPADKPARPGDAAKVLDTIPEAPQGVAWILSMVKGTTDALLSVDDLDEVLNRVLGLVFENLNVDYGAIFLCGEEPGDLKKMTERSSTKRRSRALKLSRSIAKMAIDDREAVLVTDAKSDDRLLGFDSIVSSEMRSAMCTPLVFASKVVGLIYVAQVVPGQMYTTTQLETLSILAGLSAAAVERARLRASIEQEKEIRVRLSRYHAPAVVDRIIRAGREECEEMSCDEFEISVLFCDVVGFTAMSENMPAKQVTSILNELFEEISNNVFEEGGTLDKFIGDAAMAFFGAPVRHADHAERAVRAGLAMQASVRRFNAAKRAPITLGVRVGINSGVAIVGDVGARSRKDYTCIGDTVNVAARLEGYVAKRGQVVMGPKTFELLGGRIEAFPLEKIMLRNRTQPTQPYLALDPDSDSGDPEPAK